MPKITKSKTRAPNLAEEHIEAICRVLDGWEGKLAYFGERAHPFRSIVPTCA